MAKPFFARAVELGINFFDTANVYGATKMQHLEDAVAALDVKLDDEEAKALEAAYVPHPVAGFS